MAITLNIMATSVGDLKSQLTQLLEGMGSPKEPDTIVKVPEVEEIAPVITMDRAEENMKNAPEHKLPEMPTLEEVRASLKALRDKKGAVAVKDLLAEYNAGSVPELKEEDYLVVRDRAIAEVG